MKSILSRKKLEPSEQQDELRERFRGSPKYPLSDELYDTRKDPDGDNLSQSGTPGH